MVWQFDCPNDDCEYVTSGNEAESLIEAAQQHMRDKHGRMPKRDEAEQFLIGP